MLLSVPSLIVAIVFSQPNSTCHSIRISCLRFPDQARVSNVHYQQNIHQGIVYTCLRDEVHESLYDIILQRITHSHFPSPGLALNSGSGSFGWSASPQSSLLSPVGFTSISSVTGFDSFSSFSKWSELLLVETTSTSFRASLSFFSLSRCVCAKLVSNVLPSVGEVSIVTLGGNILWIRQGKVEKTRRTERAGINDSVGRERLRHNDLQAAWIDDTNDTLRVQTIVNGDAKMNWFSQWKFLLDI